MIDFNYAAQLYSCPYGEVYCPYHDPDDLCEICIKDRIKELKRYLKDIRKELIKDES